RRSIQVEVPHVSGSPRTAIDPAQPRHHSPLLDLARFGLAPAAEQSTRDPLPKASLGVGSLPISDCLLIGDCRELEVRPLQLPKCPANPRLEDRERGIGFT